VCVRGINKKKGRRSGGRGGEKKKSERVYQDISIFLKLKIQQHGNIVFCIREGGGERGDG
jgi:hypothetical protein